MAREMTEWPSKRGPIAKICHRTDAKGIQPPLRWDCGTIARKLDGIWEMSATLVRATGSGRKGRSDRHGSCFEGRKLVILIVDFVPSWECRLR